MEIKFLESEVSRNGISFSTGKYDKSQDELYYKQNYIKPKIEYKMSLSNKFLFLGGTKLY